ncbi:23418_t:CDS:2, partial [Racocetra persica]
SPALSKSVQILYHIETKYTRSRKPSSIIMLMTVPVHKKDLAIWIDGIRIISGNPGEYIQTQNHGGYHCNPLRILQNWTKHIQSRRPSSTVMLMTLSGSQKRPVEFLME